jgi:peptidoglycan/LPS O-acetylase OafA/YrhL
LPSDWYELSKIILANILFLPGVFSIQPIVIVAWSLSYEAAFYLTLPLIIRILYMRNWQAWIRCGLIALAVLLMLTLDWRHSRMGFFACGMLLVEAKPWLNIRLDIHALITLPFCALAILFANSDIAFIIFFVFGFFLCASAFYGCGFVSNTLSYPPLCQLGTISYSYYLIHGLIMDVFFHALRPLSPWLASHGTTGWWALLPITFMATIVGSAVLFFLVEKPFSIRKLQRQVSVESKPLFTSSYSS